MVSRPSKSFDGDSYIALESPLLFLRLANATSMRKKIQKYSTSLKTLETLDLKELFQDEKDTLFIQFEKPFKFPPPRWQQPSDQF